MSKERKKKVTKKTYAELLYSWCTHVQSKNHPNSYTNCTLARFSESLVATLSTQITRQIRVHISRFSDFLATNSVHIAYVQTCIRVINTCMHAFSVRKSYGTFSVHIYICTHYVQSMYILMGKVVFICLVGSVNLVLKFLGQPGETRFQPGGEEISSGVPESPECRAPADVGTEGTSKAEGTSKWRDRL